MSIPPWTKRDNFSVAAHQRVVDVVNDFAFQTATGEQEMISTPGGHVVADRRPVIIDEIIFGKIVSAGPNSEADFTTNQFWVKKQEPVTPATSTNATTLQDDPSPQSDMIADGSGSPVPSAIVMATYVGASSSAHTLGANTIVLLIGYYPLSTANGARDKRYLLVPLAIGIDLWSDTAQVATNAASLFIDPAHGTPNVLQWSGTAPGGIRTPAGGISIKPGTNRTVLQIDDSGNAVWLPFIFWA